MFKFENSFHAGKYHDKSTHLGPYWKRMHQDWRFWVGMVLVFAAIPIYIMSVDLSIQPVIRQPK